MKDLIERLEKATGPDRELDVEIFAIADVDAFSKAVANAKDLSGPTPHQRAPEYTGSIDAALTLVPRDRQIDLSTGAKGHFATLWSDDYTCPYGLHQIQGATGPLTICIAALRAHMVTERDMERAGR